MLKLGLLGHNIAYSLSPQIHGEYYKRKGIDAEYILIDTPDLASVMPRLRNMDGFNITQPYKQAVLEYIDVLHTDVSAVNTVKVVAGKLHGYSTDGVGWLGHIKELGISLKGKDILILGAGGAAAAIVPVAVKEGGNALIYNRTAETAQKLADKHGAKAVKACVPQIIVNCTTLGLKGEDCLPAGIGLGNLQLAYDTIYNPPQTPFLKRAKNVGAATANGYRMLELQAYAAADIFII